MITHFFIGFLIAYLGFTPPSMLNLTAGKIFLEEDKKAAYQFVFGVSLVVFLQFCISYVIVSFVKESPEVLFWIKNFSIVVFTLVSVFFLRKGFSKENIDIQKKHKNNFLHGLKLSLINMFAIPFFALAYTLLINAGFIQTTISSTLLFALGLVFGTTAVLISYVLLIKKFKENVALFTKFINPVIGIITGFFAVYSTVKLYW